MTEYRMVLAKANNKEGWWKRVMDKLMGCFGYEKKKSFVPSYHWTKRAEVLLQAAMPFLEGDIRRLNTSGVLGLISDKAVSPLLPDSMHEMMKEFPGYDAGTANNGYYHYMMIEQLEYVCEQARALYAQDQDIRPMRSVRL